MRDAFARYQLIIAYMLIILLAVVGFVRVEGIARELERESIERANNNCESMNELRTNIQDFLAASIDMAPDDDFEASREQLTQLSREMLVETNCPPPPPS